MQLPSFVINRDADSARLKHVRQQAKHAGLDLRRVRAVDGYDVPSHLRDQFFSSSGELRSRLLPGEIGCYASHLLAAEQMLKQGHGAALILEDDVTFDSDFKKLLSNVMQNLPARWDIVRLSSETNRVVMSLCAVADDRHLVKYSSVPKSAGAYLLSARGARKLLRVRPRVRPVDADLRYNWIMALDTYGVFPCPVSQHGFPSTIRPSGKKRNAARGSRWRSPTVESRLRGVFFDIEALGFGRWLYCIAANLIRTHEPERQPLLVRDASAPVAPSVP